MLPPLSTLASDSLLPKENASLKKIAIYRTAASGQMTVASFIAETASDPASLAKGLSGRKEISEDQSMLFLLDSDSLHFFWMKGMMFPLDILFFDSDKSLIGILYDLPPCDDCPTYEAPAAAAYALEIKSGIANKHKIRIGDRLEFNNQ